MNRFVSITNTRPAPSISTVSPKDLFCSVARAVTFRCSWNRPPQLGFRRLVPRGSDVFFTEKHRVVRHDSPKLSSMGPPNRFLR